MAAEPDGSAVVVYESADRVRAVTISPAGLPGAPVTLGTGGFDHDSVRAAPDGTLAACCISPPTVRDPNIPPDTAQKIAVYRPTGGWRLVPTALGDRGEIETVYGNAGALLLGFVDVRESGDAGYLGNPGLARAGADDILDPPLLAPVTRPSRALAPSVAIDGSGRSVLVFQEKTRSQAFRRDAPVYASVAAPDATALPTRQRLDAHQAYEPTVRPFGPGAIAVWQGAASQWKVAIERDGTFAPAPAPPGARTRKFLGEDFDYAYGLGTAAGYAVFAWVAPDGSINVSESR